MQILLWARVFPVKVVGSHLPRGPLVVVANHACFADAELLTRVSWRQIHFLATAEAFRNPLIAHIFRHSGVIPVRRYRPDVAPYRAMRRFLGAGEIVGINVEGEDTPLGDYQGCLPTVAALVTRLNVPVVPVGISGSFDAGPRWAGILRRRPVTLRVGSPIAFDRNDPKEAIDTAIAALLDEQEQHLHLDGLPRERLYRVLWACPNCFEQSAWSPTNLHCGTCGAYFEPTPDGFFVDQNGRIRTLAALGRPVFAHAAFVNSIVCRARGFHEPVDRVKIGRLDSLGEQILRVSHEALSFDSLTIPLHEILTVSVEGGDRLQIATEEGMWQFRPLSESAFRLREAVRSWTHGSHQSADRLSARS